MPRCSRHGGLTTTRWRGGRGGDEKSSPETFLFQSRSRDDLIDLIDPPCTTKTWRVTVTSSARPTREEQARGGSERARREQAVSSAAFSSSRSHSVIVLRTPLNTSMRGPALRNCLHIYYVVSNECSEMITKISPLSSKMIKNWVFTSQLSNQCP